MGQQQLLLVVLVTILVGIATVIAINIFGSAYENSNRDAVRQDLLQGTSTAQAIWTKPTMLGGAGQDFTSIGNAEAVLLSLGMPINEGIAGDSWAVGEYGNENGTYEVVLSEASLIRLRGIPSSSEVDDDFIEAVVCRDADSRRWLVAMGTLGVAPQSPCGAGGEG